MRKSKYLGSMAWAVGATIPAAALAQTAPADTSVSTSADIIVTAQKRTERAQDVPSSIAVLPGTKLEEEGAEQLEDYAKQVPTLNIIGSSGPGTGQPTLRGVSTGSDRVAGVGIYLDDVPYTPSSPQLNAVGFSFDPDLADVQRIEVLEGPQSTLYGASAMGGLIKYVSKQPSLTETSGELRLSGTHVDGGNTGGGVKASVNTPLVQDHVGLQASFSYRKDPGFIDDAFTGQNNINQDTVIGGSLNLLAKLAENLQTKVSGFIQRIKRDGPDLVYLDASLRPELGALAYSSPVAQPTTIDYHSIADTTDLSLRFAKLTNIISYSVFKSDNLADFSYFGPYLPYFSGVPGPTDSTVSYRSIPRAKKFNEELRIASSPGRFEWLLGGFYTHESGSNPIDILGGTAAGVTYPATSPYYNVYTYQSASTYREEAGFGDLTYHFTPKLAATVGLRYSANQQSYTVATDGLLGTNNLSHQSSDHATTYLATATYKPNPNLTFYLRAASAYRPGSLNVLNSVEIAAGVPQTYGSDKLWNYEAGFKGTLLDHRITYSVDGFHMNWTDIQLAEIVNGFSAVVNAAGAHIDGAEIVLTAIPTPGLSLGLNGAYLSTEYTASVPAAGIVQGNQLPYAPHVSGSFLADYKVPMANGWSPTLGLTFGYHGPQNTIVVNGVTTRLPSYNTLDLRAGVAWKGYSLTARVDNVTNNYGLTSAGATTALGQPIGGAVIRPRTYGLVVDARF